MEKKTITYTMIGLSMVLLISLGFNISDLNMIDDNPTHSCDSPTFKAVLRCDEGLSSTTKTCKRSFGTNKRCTEGWNEIEHLEPRSNTKQWCCGGGCEDGAC